MSKPRDEDGVLALNAVCPYYTMFPLDFPRGILRGAETGAWVLDPFCGRGSTNYAARLAGLPSLGIDSNPVAVAIARAKLVSTTPGRVVAACRQILEAQSTPTDVPEGEFWDRCFHPDTLYDLCRLREALLADCTSATRQALLAFLLGRLHGPRTKKALPSYFSNQMPRTYAAKPGYAVRFWRKRRQRPPAVNVLDLVVRKAGSYFTHLPPATLGAITLGDSRTIALGDILAAAAGTARTPKVRWVITSPPYFGMRTYVPDQWLRNWFVGGPDSVPYTFEGQLTHTSPDAFAANLAAVWRNVAAVAAADVRLVIRFGGIPERSARPRDILYESLRRADCGWRVRTARSAGEASSHRRQASQFIANPERQVEEHDVFVRLA